MKALVGGQVLYWQSMAGLAGVSDIRVARIEGNNYRRRFRDISKIGW
ncbi:MAG: hypothetical protein JW732_00555 [Dehalococcoidia bacterium]|nr:hypothetical protein [Dehalococcoidia bacterium]